MKTSWWCLGKWMKKRYLATKNAPYPSRLYTEEELPEIYKIDPEELSRKTLLLEYGRGARKENITIR